MNRSNVCRKLLIVAAVLLALLLPCCAQAEASGDYTYTVNEDGATVTITGYTGTETALELPAEIEGYPVTALGDSAFARNTTLTSIVIPECVTNLGEYTFSGCSALSGVNIPGGVTRIGVCAFYGNSSLTSIELPEGLLEIGGDAFRECTKLESINLPESLLYIGGTDSGTAFEACVSLKSIRIPAGVTEIRPGTFQFCEGLTDVELPEGLTVIHWSAFYGCTSLHSLTVPSTVGNLTTSAFDNTPADFVLRVYENTYAHSWCLENSFPCELVDSGEIVTPFEYTVVDNKEVVITGYTGTATNVVIPSTIAGYPVVAIGAQAFYQNQEIVSISIPDGVGSIGDSAFDGCSALQGVELPGSVRAIGEKAFYWCSNATSLTLSAGTAIIGKDAFHGWMALTNLVIPEGVTTLAEGAFAETGLTDVTLPVSLTTIEDRAFDACNGLTNLTLSTNVSSIGANAFYDCEDLVLRVYQDSYAHVWCVENDWAYEVLFPYTYTIENGEVTITGYTGTDTAIEIPAEIEGYPVTALGDGAFARKTALTSIVIPECVTNLGESTFNGCSSLTSVNIPSGVTRIGVCAFYGNSSLTSIELPEGLLEIGGDAFRECTKLESINLPESVTTISNKAFEACTALTSIRIPAGVTVVDAEAFISCDSLTDVELPEGLKTIVWYAFAYCSSLRSVTIPASVESIDTSAFANCHADLVLCVYENSYAHTWCVENGQAYILNDAPTSEPTYSFAYTIVDGEVTITSGNGDEITIEIPAEIEGCPVTTIGPGAFSENQELTSVTLPDTLTMISEDAFAFCTSLTSVVIPDSVTRMDYGAFRECHALQQVQLSANLTSVWDEVFWGCSALENIIIPESVTEIGYNAFGNTALRSIELPASVQLICGGAFAGCANLTSIMIPEGVTWLESDTFANCSSLTSVMLPGSITTMDENVFGGCPSNLVVNVGRNEYAKNWCWENGVAYDADGAAAPLTSPETVFPTQTYLNLAESGLDKESIIASVPGMPEVQLVNGRLMVRDMGATYVSYTCWNNGRYYEMTKCGDVWVVEATPSSDFVEGFVEVSGDEGEWGMSYMGLRYNWSISGEGNGLDAVSLTSRADEWMQISIGFEVMVRYTLDNAYTIEDSYDYATGELKQEQVRRWSDSSYGYAIYDGTGALAYFEQWPDEGGYAWMYYPETGWQQNNTPCDAPAGFEAADDAFFYENYPPQVPGAVNPEPAVPYTYTIENGEVTITGYTGTETAVEIPAEIGGYPVTKIGDYAFEANGILTSVVIPEGVTEIGMCAFDGTHIQRIQLPSTLRELGESVFANNHYLTEINLPEGLTYLPMGMFIGCEALAEIELPQSLTTMGTASLALCYSLTEITIPDSVVSIGSSAFSQCTGLKHVTIPEGVASLESCLFYECRSLESVTLHENLQSVADNAFALCTSLKTIDLPQCVSYIGPYAFVDCTGLESIVIPEGVTSLEENVFKNCTALTSVTVPASVTSIHYTAFSGCTANLTLRVYANSYAHVWCVQNYVNYESIDPENVLFTFIAGDGGLMITGYQGEDGYVYIPGYIAGAQVLHIAPNCFRDNDIINYVYVEEPIRTIGDYAFADCDNLTTVQFDARVVSIGKYAFQNCCQLTSMVVPEDVTRLAYGLFAGCHNLEMVTLPRTVERMEGGLFTDCYRLRAVNLPAGIAAIPEWTFANCESLTSITIPEGVTSIATRAFSYCAGLQEVNLPDTLTEIGDYAFRRCGLLNELMLPEGLTTIGACAFQDSGLQKVCFFGRQLPVIGTDAFGPGLTVYCYGGSEVAEWALANGYTVVYIDGLENNRVLSITLPEDCRMWTRDIVDLEVKCFPETNADQLTWRSSDEDVITVKNGRITCVGAGTATITASSGAVSDAMTINVLRSVEEFTLNDWDICIVVDEYARLEILDVIPADHDAEFYWYIYDENIAIVDDNLLIAALQPGETCLAMCTTSGVWEELRLRVFNLVEGVSFENTSVNLMRGDTAQLTALVDVDGVTLTNELVRFISSDPSVAVCQSDGTVRGVGYGTATITAMASSGASAVCTVTVNSPCENHEEVVISGYAAGCLEDGLTDGRRCVLCDLITVPQKVIPATGHKLIAYEAQKPTHDTHGWQPYEACENCDYSTYVEIPALAVQSVSTFEQMIGVLPYLEAWADEYASANGGDALALVLNYLRTGVEGCTSSYWQSIAGSEVTAFVEYVGERENAHNEALDLADMIAVSSLRNLNTIILPNGETADIGAVFAIMDAIYSNGYNAGCADEIGWAGGLVDLLSVVDQTDYQAMIQKAEGDFEAIVTIIRTKLLGQTNDHAATDLRADLDGFAIMKQLDPVSYSSGALTDLFRSYFADSLSAKTRAAAMLQYRFGGEVGRVELRKAVHSAYTANSRMTALESTHTCVNIVDLPVMRKAVCYAFADYLCDLAGDWTENASIYLTDVSVTTTQLAPGVTLEKHTAMSIDEEQQIYYLGIIDVSRSGVQVMAGTTSRDPQDWSMMRTSQMTQNTVEYHSNPDDPNYIANLTPLMAINGGAFSMSTGEPEGLLLMHGQEYHAVNGNGFFGIRKDGSAVIGTMAEYEAMKADLQEGIGGAGVQLIVDGVIRCPSPTADFSSGREARTAVGITSTGRVVLMVLDGRQSPRSAGGTEFEAARIMKDAGCVDALLLSGAGSSVFVARDASTKEFGVISNPSDGVERSVATALMVFTNEHEWASGVMTVEPTITSDGEMTYTCLHCGAVKTEVISRGILGDANDDGDADLTDAVDMLEWFCESPVELNLANSDVNGDGVTDMLDIATMLVLTSGEEGVSVTGMMNEVIE